MRRECGRSALDPDGAVASLRSSASDVEVEVGEWRVVILRRGRRVVVAWRKRLGYRKGRNRPEPDVHRGGISGDNAALAKVPLH